MKLAHFMQGGLIFGVTTVVGACNCVNEMADVVELQNPVPFPVRGKAC